MYTFYFASQIPDPKHTVCVDGFFPCCLHLSHWPGNHTPAVLKADSSTEIVFALIDHPDKNLFLQDILYVANNHYDVDGVLAAFTLMYEDEARRMKQQIISAARTGDFSEYTSEDALKCCIVLENLGNETDGPFAEELSGLSEADKTTLLYNEAFKLIPELFTDPDAFEHIWSKEFAGFQEGNVSFEKRESVFSNYDDCGLSVLESVYKLHPCVVNQWSKHQIVLLVHKAGKEHFYKLMYKTYNWFDTGKPRTLPRPGFESLAQELNLIDDRKNGLWTVIGTTPEENYDYRLEYTDTNGNPVTSALQVYEVENLVMDFLINFA